MNTESDNFEDFKFDLFKDNFGEWVNEWKGDKDFDIDEAVDYLHDCDENYNNADVSTNMRCFDKADIDNFVRQML